VDAIDFNPYYEGFKGSVIRLEDHKFLIKGVYEKIDNDKIRITELPVGAWTMPYTTYLEGLMDGSTKNGKKIAPTIRDFTSISTEVSVDFTIVFPRGKLSELESTMESTNINGVEKLLKLATTVSTTNMHMFNKDCKLHKYASVPEIIEEFYGVRLHVYEKRKQNLIAHMENKLVKLSNRAKYIMDTLNNKIDLRRKSAAQVTELLTQMEFKLIDGDFKYLIKMPMDSVTQENVDNIMKEKSDTEEELDKIRNTTLQKMWLVELNHLEKEYIKYKTKREKLLINNQKVKPNVKTTKKIKSKK
jgi:DNA topoisomerase-2